MEEYQTQKIELKLDEFLQWMVDSKKTIATETVRACEYFMESDVDSLSIFDVILLHEYGRVTIAFKLNRDELPETLKYIMQWSLDEEEYEISYRVKQITDKLKI